MRASQSASTNIEEEVVDLSSGPIINVNSDHSRRGPNLIYSPGFSNNIDSIQVRCVDLLIPILFVITFVGHSSHFRALRSVVWIQS